VDNAADLKRGVPFDSQDATMVSTGVNVEAKSSETL
jgi:hypothetical protein